MCLQQKSDDLDYTSEQYAILTGHAKSIRNEKHTRFGLAMFSHPPKRGMFVAASRIVKFKQNFQAARSPRFTGKKWSLDLCNQTDVSKKETDVSLSNGVHRPPNGRICTKATV